jgi:hypothetical protein
MPGRIAPNEDVLAGSSEHDPRSASLTMTQPVPLPSVPRSQVIVAKCLNASRSQPQPEWGVSCRLLGTTGHFPTNLTWASVAQEGLKVVQCSSVGSNRLVVNFRGPGFPRVAARLGCLSLPFVAFSCPAVWEAYLRSHALPFAINAGYLDDDSITFDIYLPCDPPSSPYLPLFFHSYLPFLQTVLYSNIILASLYPSHISRTRPIPILHLSITLSTTSMQCENCGGSGTVKCDGCNGAGCGDCKGGQATCPVCEGNGHISADSN